MKVRQQPGTLLDLETCTCVKERVITSHDSVDDDTFRKTEAEKKRRPSHNSNDPL